MMGKVKRAYKKRLATLDEAIYWDCGKESEYAGQVVTVTAHNGPFRTIVTADGRVFGVGRGLLFPVNR